MLHQYLQNFTDQLHFYILAKPISKPTSKNLKVKKKSYFQKSFKKQEAMNLIPTKTKAPISKTSAERLKMAFKHYRTETNLLKKKLINFRGEIKNIVN